MPASGPIVVTGSTGGVGCLAVKLLAKLGYEVAAVTGKPDQHERLRAWGATTILGRGEVVSASDKPLLTARWGGAVDTVGGATLATIVRETKPYGVVAACGLVGGVELPLTVHPFILRGVILAGIGSAMLPYDRRVEIWRRLASEWRVAGLDELATTVELADLEGEIERILRGEVVGRTVVRVG
jgi:acrylyl-CoA reductase (NADPH)